MLWMWHNQEISEHFICSFRPVVTFRTLDVGLNNVRTDLRGQDWQRRLFCDLPTNWWWHCCPSNWKQKAWLLSYPVNPNRTGTVKAWTCKRWVCWDKLTILYPALVAIMRRQPVLTRFLSHVLIRYRFLWTDRFGWCLWGQLFVCLDWIVLAALGLICGRLFHIGSRLVLVNSCLISRDFLHWTVVFWSQIKVILVLWRLRSSYIWYLQRE